MTKEATVRVKDGVIAVQMQDFEEGEKVHVLIFSDGEKVVKLHLGAPGELWDIEMELSNICAYAGDKTGPQLARRFIEVKTKVRDMIRAYGYKGVF